MDEQNIFDLAFSTESISLERFEEESFDDRHCAAFDGRLNVWWDKFWGFFAANIAIGATALILNRKKREKEYGKTNERE